MMPFAAELSAALKLRLEGTRLLSEGSGSLLSPSTVSDKSLLSLKPPALALTCTWVVVVSVAKLLLKRISAFPEASKAEAKPLTPSGKPSNST